MNDTELHPIRVLVVDDEPAILDAYRELLSPATNAESEARKDSLEDLRARLYPRAGAPRAAPPAASTRTRFRVEAAGNAEAAVEAVRLAIASGAPFAVVFLDMRMPPGKDGAWAAAEIRAMDENVSICLCSAYSDVDTEELSARIPPEDKFFFLAKPFHPQEVRQMALALGHKWRAEQRIAQLAYYDSLTGLPNRAQFRDRLRACLEHAERHGRSLALLYIDLDNFKRINDTLGHTAGDELLRVVADRLRTTVRKSDDFIHVNASRQRGNDCARLGGDEFMALLPEVTSPGDAGLIADRLIRALSQSVMLGDTECTVTPSIGVAMYPQDGQDAESLLRHADLAMYAAKRAAPGTFVFYDEKMNAGAVAQLQMESRLRNAIANNELSLHYQPQFDLHSGRISSIEALLRWNSPELGLVPPLSFIPLAEATGLILSIGEWVLRAACSQAQRWLAAGLPLGRIAVNVSPVQFAQREFVERVAAVLADTGLPAACLELEITESLFMKDEAWAYQVTRRLKTLGVALAIDDFGTGYSSFGRLKDYPVDRLKIDKSFVTRPGADSVEDGAIVAAMISMAKTMGLGVVAEGVEDFSQLLFLQEQHCELGQGFLLSSPLTSGETEQFLRRMHEAEGATDAERRRRLGN